MTIVGKTLSVALLKRAKNPHQSQIKSIVGHDSYILNPDQTLGYGFSHNWCDSDHVHFVKVNWDDKGRRVPRVFLEEESEKFFPLESQEILDSFFWVENTREFDLQEDRLWLNQESTG